MTLSLLSIWIVSLLLAEAEEKDVAGDEEHAISAYSPARNGIARIRASSNVGGLRRRDGGLSIRAASLGS